ncbi:tyrosine-type recombinase/integrase [Eisenbergiella tayi]|uniref:Tyrosine-type recombinase/integrase n=1 Tax=Eisenbergiella porci TaxID=2652274 RepID=A0A6N7WI32_9FIRM|nr:site-specific integrase [Eisenbergiella porci]MSS90147.1 tyrosine-type recombinase/integrase [Eisenbergiella porci]
MPTAKKLPSGSWRCQAYSHTEMLFDANGNPIIDPKTGKQKQKRIYESFTSDDPSRFGKLDAEKAALDFLESKKSHQYTKMTLRDAINKYISDSDAVLSPTTIKGYEIIRDNGFQDLMDLRIRDITNEKLKEAVNKESKRPSTSKRSKGQPISPKTVSNEYGLLTAVLGLYHPKLSTDVKLPAKVNHIKELIPPEVIFNVVHGTEIELPVLLAMWLSFTISEIKGLTKSKSIQGDYITIVEVVVHVGGKDISKKQAKEYTRTRRHRIPSYIKLLIDNVQTDQLVTMSGKAVSNKFSRLLKKNNLPHISFHDLRHVNASVMAMLKIPDKYAQERGGWKTDAVMKKTYMQTFSEERQRVDNIIDDYFERQISMNENVSESLPGYTEWLKAMGLKDTPSIRDKYQKFAQDIS